jgi:intein/homing endonuclease
VNTRDGLTPIDELGVGDEVLSFDKTKGEVVYARVANTFKSVQYSYFVINGTIEVTAGHPFRTNGAWVNSEDIRVGDELWDERDELIRVQSIDTVMRGVRVYNIEVEGTNTFFIEGVLVHNKPPDPEG